MGENLFITTTQTSPSRAFSYTVVLADGAVADALCADVQDDTAVGGPMQDVVPASYAFAEQRGVYGEETDAIVFWKVQDGEVFKQFSGQAEEMPPCTFCYDPLVQPEATSALGVDGQADAPAAGSIVAAFYDEQTLTLHTVGD